MCLTVTEFIEISTILCCYRFFKICARIFRMKSSHRHWCTRNLSLLQFRNIHFNVWFFLRVYSYISDFCAFPYFIVILYVVLPLLICSAFDLHWYLFNGVYYISISCFALLFCRTIWMVAVTIIPAPKKWASASVVVRLVNLSAKLLLILTHFIVQYLFFWIDVTWLWCLSATFCSW